MAKLHELLAVEKNLSDQAGKMRTDLANTFEKKRHLFEERKRSFQPLAEGAELTVEEQQDIQTTVHSELQWLFNTLRKAINVACRIDYTNAKAVGDIITEDGETLFKDVPTTSLLQLEKRVAEVRDLILRIPTLDPAKGFSPDKARGKGIYKAREVSKARTTKQQRPLVLYPHSPEHPAQTQLITEDVKIGTILEQEWSSLLTPSLKAELLARADTLLRAVKAARARANETEVDQSPKIGEALLDYILTPLEKAVQ